MPRNSKPVNSSFIPGLKYDYELARNLKKAKKSNRTLKDLMDRLKRQDGNSALKTWVYDAVKLAVDEKDFVDSIRTECSV